VHVLSFSYNPLARAYLLGIMNELSILGIPGQSRMSYPLFNCTRGEALIQ